MYKQNLHTHSKYCDGKNCLEDMVLGAISKGFDSIGFSGHSYTPFDERYCMSQSATAEYFSECRKLSEKYGDKIKIYCGIEQDFYSPPPEYEFDYIIGSVHYVCVGDEYISIDDEPGIHADAARKYFGGDIYALVEEYYSTVAKVVTKTKCDVIGHFDVISKFTERDPRIDVNNTRYKVAAESAIDELLRANALFEMNSGAVAGGYRTKPYPSESLLLRICRGGGKITLSSDCHDKNKLDFCFDEMKKLAVSSGFCEIYMLREGVFVPEPIK